MQRYEIGARLFAGEFIEHRQHVAVGNEGFFQRTSGLRVRREIVVQDRRVVALSHEQ
ncbi:hypothetical protein D3C86_2239750 [compost metagenome]